MNLKTLLMALGVTAAAITFAVAGSAHAYPSEWRRIGSGGGGDVRGIVYVMPHVWRVPGYNARRLWERLESPDTGNYYIELTEVNCDGRNTRALQTDGYDANGSPVYSRDYPSQWDTAVPGSLQDGVVDYACAR